MDFVAIDFETANEKRDSACAIGLTEVKNGRVKNPIYHLIRPTEMRFSPWNTQVHGISAHDVVKASSLKQLWPSIRHLIENRLIVAHNASFDLSVLKHSFLAESIPVPELDYLCTLKLSRRAWPDLGSYSLGILAQIHGIKLKHHHAGSDSKACAELLLLAAKAHAVACPLELATLLAVKTGTLRL